MTTIITDGRYLLADHRVGISHKVIPDLINDEWSHDPIVTTMYSDRILKISETDNNL